MHVEGDFRKWTQSVHDRWPDRDVRDEMAIHDINMNPVGAGTRNGQNFLAELGEIGGKN
jgi:hypothetical protein